MLIHFYLNNILWFLNCIIKYTHMCSIKYTFRKIACIDIHLQMRGMLPFGWWDDRYSECSSSHPLGHPHTRFHQIFGECLEGDHLCHPCKHYISLMYLCLYYFFICILSFVLQFVFWALSINNTYMLPISLYEEVFFFTFLIRAWP